MLMLKLNCGCESPFLLRRKAFRPVQPVSLFFYPLRLKLSSDLAHGTKPLNPDTGILKMRPGQPEGHDGAVDQAFLQRIDLERELCMLRLKIGKLPCKPLILFLFNEIHVPVIGQCLFVFQISAFLTHSSSPLYTRRRPPISAG